jgi:hypothetical protein
MLVIWDSQVRSSLLDTADGQEIDLIEAAVEALAPFEYGHTGSALRSGDEFRLRSLVTATGFTPVVKQTDPRLYGVFLLQSAPDRWLRVDFHGIMDLDSTEAKLLGIRVTLADPVPSPTRKPQTAHPD